MLIKMVYLFTNISKFDRLAIKVQVMVTAQELMQGSCTSAQKFPVWHPKLSRNVRLSRATAPPSCIIWPLVLETTDSKFMRCAILLFCGLHPCANQLITH